MELFLFILIVCLGSMIAAGIIADDRTRNLKLSDRLAAQSWRDVREVMAR